MVVRPILPVVESRSIEGGRLIGTPIFGRLHFFPYSSIASWEAAIAEKYRMVKGTNLLLSSNVTMRRYGDNSLVKWLTSNCLDLGKNQVVHWYTLGQVIWFCLTTGKGNVKNPTWTWHRIITMFQFDVIFILAWHQAKNQMSWSFVKGSGSLIGWCWCQIEKTESFFLIISCHVVL